jgi:biopolymer transport protein ExbB
MPFASVNRPRWAYFVLVCLLALFVVSSIGPALTVAFAQEGGDAGAAVPAAKKNLFMHIITSAGIIFGPMILMVSIALVALVVLLLMDLRMNVAIPPAFVEEFTDTVNKRKFKEAFDLCRAETSFLGQVITAGMGRLQYGIDDAREAAMNTVESVKASKDQLISYLGTIGTLGPLIGLVGTVFGMILAFMKLSDASRPANAADLADDISHALVVTMLGVGLSLFAITFHTFFKNRLTRVTMDTSNIADDLLTQMYHNSRKPGGPPAPAANSQAAAPVKQA